MKKCHKTSIGGSALIEGVMMRGPLVAAMAVRKPDGEIDLSSWEVGGLNRWYQKTPFVRGVFNFIDSIRLSYRCLLKSADIAAVSEEPPSGLEKKLQDKFGDKFSDIYGVFAIVLGVMIALGLFMVLPTVLIGLLRPVIKSGVWLSVIEATLKIGAFVLYLYLVSRMQDIKRVFAYHGAEHKTIACYEAGEELTPQNAAKMSRFHPRCGTSFLIIVMIVSVLVFSFVTWSNLLMRVVIKLLCLPIVMGIAYEIIKLAGRYDNPVTRAVSAPGLWLQRLTTCEPDEPQLEVAIAAMKACIPEDKTQDRW